ncbi:hypothetical protein ABN197_18860 [Providencia alcalifaciens]|uniref:hypothetical protein n=1 Tax=Providencia alcalifaciens TaxID=126385 RepID=UPI0032DA8650
MTDKTGGAAFPASGHPDMQFVAQEGMSLRDYFAAKALQGMLSNEQCHPFGMSFSEEYHADCAYRMADAMLKARG